MPLDKIKEIEEYAETHKSSVLHIQDNPVACILEENSENKLKLKSMQSEFEIKASLRGFLNKHDEIGLIMGCKFKLQINQELFEYTIYPTMDFIDSIIFNEMIFIIDNEMNQIFSCKILTDQFVKTKSEFEKFKKLSKN
ncbi:hypothetical protein [Nitrosopumilus sp. Nsub]|uniref:hypothetical protein n=1 Tax=Nitrosopumilus sp. Nsub TaxID=1776294 RepID=UPI000833E08C|nr:hypothetical protein [Nitrosopumilus sp. Nsub]